MIDLVNENKNAAPLGPLCRILGLEPKQQTEALAARANMASIVQMLHDLQSRLIEMLMEALAKGKLCIMDISLLHGSDHAASMCPNLDCRCCLSLQLEPTFLFSIKFP